LAHDANYELVDDVLLSLSEMESELGGPVDEP
jgi:hypothetical protein